MAFCLAAAASACDWERAETEQLIREGGRAVRGRALRAANYRAVEDDREACRIGLARRYLQIAGEWQDHLLYQRTAD
jgi:hypothetical protein